MHNAATTLFSKVEKRGQSPLLAENQFITNPIYAMNNKPGKHDKGGGCGVNVNCSQVNTNSTDRMEENHNSTSNHHRSFTTDALRIKGHTRPLFRGRQNSKEGRRLSLPVSPSFYMRGVAGQSITPRSMGSLPQGKVSITNLSNTMIAQQNK